MATYKITDPNSGKTLKVTGDSPPSEQELKDIFSQVGGSTPAAKSESKAEHYGKAFAKGVRPALEIGGMLAGGAVGTAVAPGVGTLVGAGLGYAGSRQVSNLIDQSTGKRENKGLPRELLEAGKDVAMGAAMEAGGAVASVPIKAAIKGAGKLAPRLYESVAKIAPRSVTKIEREKAVQTALDNKIPATQKGFEKLKGMIDETNTQIAKVIDEAEELSKYARKKNKKTGLNEYDEDMIKISDISKRLTSVKKWATDSYPDPTPVIKMINQFKRNIFKTRGKEISVAAAQKLKQGIYRRLSDAAYGEYAAPVKEMDKAFARGIKEELVAKYPILQKLNSKDSALISLQNILEKTVNRTRNWNVVGLGDYGAAIGGAELAGGGGAGIGLLASKILKSPAVMSRIAFALNRASKVKLPSMTASQVATYGVAQKSGIPDIPAEEIIGNVLNRLTPSAAASEDIPGPAKKLSASKRGIELYTENNWDGAIKEWRKALKENPKNAKQIIKWINTAKKEKTKYQEFMQRQSKNRGLITAQLPAMQ